MDRVRLGRALGFGARAAAKTLTQVADAAMSPNPNPSSKPAQPTASTPPPAQRAGNIAAATSRIGRATWEPVKRHSRELWLQITGSLFALLALTMAGGMWELRAAVRASFQTARTNHSALWSQTNLKFYFATAAVLMFGYFAVSNFVRAGCSSAAAKAQQRLKQ